MQAAVFNLSKHTKHTQIRAPKPQQWQQFYSKAQQQGGEAPAVAPARRSKCPCTQVHILKEPPLVVVRDERFFFSTSPPQRCLLVFGAHVSLLFPPYLIDEGCGYALRAWFGGWGVVHTACARRISAATAGSPTNVIGFGIFWPTSCSRNVLTNHRALENALLRWLSSFKYW